MREIEFMASGAALTALQRRFPELGFAARPLCTYPDGRTSDQLWVAVLREHLREVALFLRDDPACAFVQLADLSCVDYLNHPEPPSDERFGVTYALLSHRHQQRLWLKVFVSDPEPEVPSVFPIWRGAEWMEREVYDMFGIRFTEHPDLRRILMPINFADFPLRKDYPLRGKGEREAFEVVGRESA